MSQPPRTNGNTPGFTQGKPVRLGILSNDRSGGNRKDPDAVYRQVRDVSNAEYHRVRTPDEISAALKVLANNGTDIVVVNGGDGTIHATFNALFNDRPFDQPPPLALLCAGTTSMTAGDVGLRGKQSKAIQRLLRHTSKPDSSLDLRQRSIVRVRTPGIPEDQYGMFFGTAAIYQAITYCRAHLHSIGFKGEVGPGIALARFAIAMVRRDPRYVNPLTLEIDIDGNAKASRDYLLVMASTLQRLFLGIRPFWGKEPEPLQFTAIAAHPTRVIRSLPSLLRGKQKPWMDEDNGYISHNVTRISLDLDSGFTLDGELFTPDAKAGPTIISRGDPLKFIRV